MNTDDLRIRPLAENEAPLPNEVEIRAREDQISALRDRIAELDKRKGMSKGAKKRRKSR